MITTLMIGKFTEVAKCRGSVNLFLAATRKSQMVNESPEHWFVLACCRSLPAGKNTYKVTNGGVNFY